MSTLISKRSQLQWLALLAVAVLLPTVSLLWFLVHVVENERLVIRQKFAALYHEKLNRAGADTQERLTARIKTVRQWSSGSNPYSALRDAVLNHDGAGLVLWTADGTLVYPRSLESGGGDASPDHPLASAWQFEFQKREFADAAALYAGYTEHPDPRVATAAMLGRTRCLLRLGRADEAIAECRRAAFFSPVPPNDLELRLTLQNARLALLNALKAQPRSPDHDQLMQRTAEIIHLELYSEDDARPPLPPHQNLFLAKKVLEVLPEPQSSASRPHPGMQSTRANLSQLGRLVAAEELSIAAAESVPPFSGPFESLFRLNLDGRAAFGLRCRTSDGIAMMVLAEPAVGEILLGYAAAFNEAGVACRILDGAGVPVISTSNASEKPFLTAALPGSFPGWNVELFLGGGDVFERAARRQITVYVWTGALVILLFLAAAALASLAVGRQIRLNRMKNDFIATVSHELKTPLASMRVLMDTLLEGNIRDETQAKQYLRLAAKENERLSRMIDNFLTFSRMERNKQAFVMAESDPAAIAMDAVDSVQTKYVANHCHLSVEMAPDLPRILADHDALVTVLVNLFDNACKYTGPDKRIGLKVFRKNGGLCFAVCDNGIGLTRRQTRRIFDRFYQVDNSLARRAEGSGLGLSIVKFIVEAHKGAVTVESKPGKGSTFYVRLPAAHRNTSASDPE